MDQIDFNTCNNVILFLLSMSEIKIKWLTVIYLYLFQLRISSRFYAKKINLGVVEEKRGFRLVLQQNLKSNMNTKTRFAELLANIHVN